MVKVRPNVNLLTQEGYEKIISELKYRETQLRDSLAETLNEMRSQGDLKENDGYSMAVEQNDQNEEEILRLKDRLKTSKVVKNHSKTKIGIGNMVTVLSNDIEKTYSIVGEDNANPLEGKISYKSPIGSALMDKKAGDEIELTTPRGITKYKVVGIE